MWDWIKYTHWMFLSSLKPGPIRLLVHFAKICLWRGKKYLRICGCTCPTFSSILSWDYWLKLKHLVQENPYFPPKGILAFATEFSLFLYHHFKFSGSFRTVLSFVWADSQDGIWLLENQPVRNFGGQFMQPPAYIANPVCGINFQRFTKEENIIFSWIIMPKTSELESSRRNHLYMYMIWIICSCNFACKTI